MPQKRNTPEDFWRKVDQSGGPEACWPWTGGTFKTVPIYGSFCIGDKRVHTHRFAYEDVYGPTDMNVLHGCDFGLCCNPIHLEEGTHWKNMADMVARGRSARGVGSSKAKLVPDEVTEIHRLYKEGARQADLAAQFGISQPAVSAIVRGKNWRHWSLRDVAA